MKPHLHARISVKQHGGNVDDYMAIHEFLDHSKSSVADVRHRSMLHSSWGIYVVSQVFGNLIINSDGKEVSTRDIAEEHVIQDLGFIPSMDDWLKTMTIEPWMSGTRKTRKVMSFEPTID
jgi:hypothetical protein